MKIIRGLDAGFFPFFLTGMKKYLNLISSRINYYNALTNGGIKHPNLFIRKKKLSRT